jgi:hypothetical protein
MLVHAKSLKNRKAPLPFAIKWQVAEDKFGPTGEMVGNQIYSSSSIRIGQ